MFERDTPEYSSSLNRPVRSVAAASNRVSDLLQQAMALFEIDRKAAWRCLSDASTLLCPAEARLGAQVMGVNLLKPGGLATWQARRVLAFIEENLASKLEIDEVAQVVTLSRSHFSRAFKHCIGFSPMEYIVMRRVERAKAMIRGTRVPLAEVALACGFADQAHLNRRFRHLVGISPGRWRRSNSPGLVPTPRERDEIPIRVVVGRVGSADETFRSACR